MMYLTILALVFFVLMVRYYRSLHADVKSLEREVSDISMELKNLKSTVYVLTDAKTGVVESLTPYHAAQLKPEKRRYIKSGKYRKKKK